MTHTPGPWTIFGTFNVRGANGRGVATTGGINDGRIADGGFAENSANARLIAAAPDLLEALKFARQIIGHPDDAGTKLIDDVIAKATGQ